jgi:hypothetical protein
MFGFPWLFSWLSHLIVYPGQYTIEVRHQTTGSNDSEEILRYYTGIAHLSAPSYSSVLDAEHAISEIAVILARI